MKKLVLFFAVAFAMSFASCGNKAAESTEATDSVAVVEEVAVEVVDTVAADSVAVDSAAVVAENCPFISSQWSLRYLYLNKDTAANCFFSICSTCNSCWLLLSEF